MYEYVVGVKTAREAQPTVHSVQPLSLREVMRIVKDGNAEEERKAKEENREVSRWYVGLFRSLPPWQEILDSSVEYVSAQK